MGNSRTIRFSFIFTFLHPNGLWQAAKLAVGGLKNAVEAGVFDFLNAQLGRGAGKAPAAAKKPKALGRVSGSALGVKLVEAEMKEKQAKLEMAKCREAIQRNKGRCFVWRTGD